VILHNDFHNSINRVVWRLWRIITGMNMERATEVTWEAQIKGRAVAKTCHKELAEALRRSPAGEWAHRIHRTGKLDAS
jgi:ATP-dependent Clp protease adapter protein ClpS